MVTEYKEWNNALWTYFFPEGIEDPVLALDDNLLREIGENANIRCIGQNWGDDLLIKSLISEDNFREFRYDWRLVVGNNCNSARWDQLVSFLENETLDGKPAYFAMLCAIMFIASTIDNRVTHAFILNKAKYYLGEAYNGRVGEFVDELLQCLHRDQISFNPDKMDVSQRNMSRIKYHLVLRPDQRKDFIDFLEVGNLKWEEGSYADYANGILIPALHKANKPNRFFEIVENAEFIPYVKNILQSDLQWGKAPEESVTNNTCQIRDVRWKFEMELDFYGEPSFFISAESYLPFGIILNNDRFEISEDISDYIAYNVPLLKYALANFNENGYEYHFLNLAQEETGQWCSELYFQQVDDRLYHQVTAPVEGKHLIKLIPVGTRNRANDQGWHQSDIVINGYNVYEIDSYVGRVRNRGRDIDRVNDTFRLYGLGSWFSICLEEGQIITWKPDEFGSIETPIHNTISAPNGKTYFQLPRNQEGSYLRGNLFVKDLRGKEKLSEQIKRDFCWDGRRMIYGYNEWGEVVEDGNIQRTQANPAQRVIMPSNEEISHNPLSRDSNMLIQILYDVADENGCVSQRKMVEVLKFVLDFYNIDPTKEKLKNRLIYALRRLGYVVALKLNGEFVNQLVAPYLELTNYSIWEHNAYLVKGVYDIDNLQSILQDLPMRNNIRPIKYKRPIRDRRGSEYDCLPDMILFYTNRPIDNWKIIDHPIAYDLLASMADMNKFEGHFSINDGGDDYITNEHPDAPCMIFNNGEDYLCLRRNERYYKKKYYSSDGVFKPILKHLSRIYCQNAHSQPVVIFGSQRVRGEVRIDYDHIRIVKGMGKPTIFDIALCDLHLGIPRDEHFFVMYNQRENLPIDSRYPYTSGNIYSVNGLHNDTGLMKSVLERISAREIDNPFNSSAIFVSAPRGGYEMRIENISSPKIKLGVISRIDNHTIAFSVGSFVYAWNPALQQYEEVEGVCVNHKLSDVISNNYRTNGQLYNGQLPNFNSDRSKTVTIIRRNQ